MNHGYQRWSLAYDAKDGVHGKHDAATRLATGDMLELSIEPRFRLAPETRYYCIGSCFARHVERALIRAGSEVLSGALRLPDSIDAKSLTPRDPSTKFNTFSMNRMIDLARPGSEDETDFLVELRPGEFWNPQLHSQQTFGLEQARALHASFCENVRRIAEADCIIITLGLTEYWFDQETGMPLNNSPLDWRHARRTGRFVFRNSGFAENMAQLREMIGKIRAIGKPGVRVVVTVSPVPLQFTFENRDILVVNTWSKSVLRAVCGELVAEDPDIDYFPSYELVLLSPADQVWHHDRRHVNEPFVRRVMEVFKSSYMTAGA